VRRRLVHGHSVALGREPHSGGEAGQSGADDVNGVRHHGITRTSGIRACDEIMYGVLRFRRS
jgi:hypothetical protein